MAKVTQKNFRLSSTAVGLLGKLKKKFGISETEVLEHCIARYAGEVGVDVESAKALLMEHFGRTLAPRPSRSSSENPSGGASDASLRTSGETAFHLAASSQTRAFPQPQPTLKT